MAGRAPGRRTRRSRASLVPGALLIGLLAGCSANVSQVRDLPRASSLPSGLGQLVTVTLTTAPGVDAGAAAGQKLDVPNGWKAEVWAAVPGARMAVWAPDGRLIVSTGSEGQVVAIAPGSGDAAPTVDTLLSGLDDPQGVAMATEDGHEVLVVGEDSRITKWTYAAGRVSDRTVVLGDLPTGGHGAKMVAVHGDQVVYNVGSATNREASDRTATPERATIAMVGLDGTGNHTVATGVRNGEGLAFAPDGTVYAAINQADNQPYPFHDGDGTYGQVVTSYVNEHPNDQVSRIAQGTDMGWPYCVPDSRGHADLLGLGYVDDPLNNPAGASLDCTSIGTTQLGLPAHSAPIGLVFTNGSNLPASLADGALITAHGSWNRQPPRDPYVAYSAWDASTRRLTAMRVVVAGFQEADGTRWGRSVDAVPGPDGSIAITDDTAGLVYRLTPGT